MSTWGIAPEVSRTMQDHISAFLKDPLNGPQLLGWEPVNSSITSGGKVLRFGADGKAVQQVDRVEIDGTVPRHWEIRPVPISVSMKSEGQIHV
ncbi:hypothetical protein ASPTUDRAFT_40783 [Aspergillus tubingensis CBS 134.48]|uniref:Uncharacterized protein n=1 Tax=Aspergillus tubingensis (strain CBS 134.48) TaxID=767770 RepID=A0A1L9N6F9_ASPTC|nr:hypothetical protein ASPTUDRAFT_40783 [Aspergillus tubingensis CBS 134.48]